MPQQVLHFPYRWLKPVARFVLVAFLPMAVMISNFGPAPKIAAAATEARQDPWGTLPDVITLEPFPYTLNTQSPDGGADPLAISTLSAQTALWFTLPPQEPYVTEVDVAFTAAPADQPSKAVTIHEARYPVSDRIAYTWDGDGLDDAVYFWSYTASPALPECQEGEICPTPESTGPSGSTLSGGPYPVIIDWAPPEILGLHNLKDGWLGVEVRDLTSGTARIEAAIYPADSGSGGGGGGGGPITIESVTPADAIDLPEHPLRAVVRLPLPDVAGEDLIVEVTATDLAGNRSVERLPLHPVLRTGQLGESGPWPTATGVMGGEPLAVNLVSGNGYFFHEEFSLPAHSLSLDLTRSYNHQNRQKGLLGWGWRLSLETHLRLWPGQMATWTDETGTEYVFDLSGGEARPYVDGIPRAWPRLSATGGGYLLRWPDGSSIRFHQDGRVDAVSDAGQDRIDYQYEDGRLAAVEAVGTGRRVRLHYNADGTLWFLRIYGSDGSYDDIDFEYEDGNLTRVTGIYGREVSFTYDRYHRMRAITHHLEEQTGFITWDYGHENRVTYVGMLRSDLDFDTQSRAQEKLELTYVTPETGGRPVAAEVAGPRSGAVYHWDELGRPHKTIVSLGDGKTAADVYAYQGHNLVAHTDPLGRTTRWTYDEHDNVLTELLPDEQNKVAYSYQYHESGLVRSVTSRAIFIEGGVEHELYHTTDTFDETGRIRSSFGPEGEETRYAYHTGPHSGMLAEVTNPSGFVTRYEYDGQGQLARVLDWPDRPGAGAESEAEWTRYEYDGMGRLAVEEVKLFHEELSPETLKTEFHYNPYTGDVTVTSHQPARVASSNLDIPDVVTRTTYLVSYLPGARPLQVRRWPVGQERDATIALRYQYNNAGMVTRTETPDGIFAYQYDAEGSVRAEATPEGVTVYEYDPAGRVIKEVTPRGGYYRYEYDAADQLVGVIQAKTVLEQELKLDHTRYEYDKLGRMTLAESAVTGRHQTFYKQGPNGLTITTSYAIPNPEKGRLDGSSTEEGYDRYGNLRYRREGNSYVFFHPLPDPVTLDPSAPADMQWLSRLPAVEVHHKQVNRDQGETPDEVEPQSIRTYWTDGRGRVVAESNAPAAAANGANTSLLRYDGLDRMRLTRTPEVDVDPFGDRKTRLLDMAVFYDADGNVYEEYVRDQQGDRIVHSRYRHTLLGKPLVSISADGTGRPPLTIYYAWEPAREGQAPVRLEHVTYGGEWLDGEVANPQAIYDLTYDETTGFPDALISQVAARKQTMYHLTFDEYGMLSRLQRGTELPRFFKYDPFGRPITRKAGEYESLTSYRPGYQETSVATQTFSATADGGDGPVDPVFGEIRGGYLVTETYPDGTARRMLLDGLGRVVAEADNAGAVTRYAYDENGNLASKTDPRGHTVYYQYDALGRVVEETDARGYKTAYRYEENGRRVIRTDPFGNETITEYNLRGLPVAVTDARGYTTAYQYDHAGNLTKTISPTGATTTMEYDATGNLIKVVDPLGRETVLTRNALGQVTAIRDGAGNTEYFTYNPFGKVATHTSKEGAVTHYEYNEAGRLVRIIDPENHVTELGYDDLGRHAWTKDPEGNTTTYGYDSRDFLVRVEEPGGKVTDYDYDEVGRLIYQKDARGIEVHYAYDENGRLVRETFGDGSWIAYTYDPNGNLLEKRDSAGAVTSYQYDAMNRVTRIDRPDGTWVTYTYDAVGNKLTETTPEGTTTYTYTPENRLATSTDPYGTVTEYIYDAAGNPKTELVDGQERNYVYDGANRVTRITDALGYSYEYEYDRDGFVTAIKLPNGLTTHIEYDSRHGIRRMWTEGPDGTILEGSYTHEARGYVQTLLENGRSFAFAYDDRGEMTEVLNPRGDLIRYRYDKAGNLTRREAVIGGPEADRGESITVDELMVAILLYLKGQEAEEGAGAKNGPSEGGAPEGHGKPEGKSEGKPDGKPKGKSGVLEVGQPIASLTADVLPLLAKSGGGGQKPEKETGAGNGSKPDTGSKSGGGAKSDTDSQPDAGTTPDGGADSGKGGSGTGSGKDKADGGKQPPSDDGGKQGQKPDDQGPKPDHKGQPGQEEKPGNRKGGPKEEPPGQARKGLKEALADPQAQACLHAIGQGKGKKIGLYRKCGEQLGLTGLEFHLLSIIDNLVNGEYYLPPGDKEELFALVREVAYGYTIVGTTYEYNDQNQLTRRHNLVRDEVHSYTYDADGNMTSNGRSQFFWDDENRLVKVIFPDGEGVRYTYDALGRRASRTTFNAQGKGEHTTRYEYEGSSWNVARERNKDGEVTASYTYDLQGRPLTITYEGQTYWYLYNAHGDVVALTDAEGKVKARYEYDEWGRLQAMYDEYGRVREGYGTIGDIGTGPVRPVIGMPTPGSDGGKEPKKEKPGRGPSAGDSTLTGDLTLAEDSAGVEAASGEEGELQIQGVIGEPDDLVKANPYRYAGYRYDRETQYYYLQSRYYDARLGRFLSRDTWPGDVRNPLSLNRYIYGLNNPVNHVDPTGLIPLAVLWWVAAGVGLIAAGAAGYYVYQQTRDPWKALVAGVVAGLTAAGLVVGYYLYFTGVAALVKTLAAQPWAIHLGAKLFTLSWYVQNRYPYTSGAVATGLTWGLEYALTADDPNLGGFVEQFLIGALVFTAVYAIGFAAAVVHHLGGLRNTVRWGLNQVLLQVQRVRYGSGSLAVTRGRSRAAAMSSTSIANRPSTLHERGYRPLPGERTVEGYLKKAAPPDGIIRIPNAKGGLAFEIHVPPSRPHAGMDVHTHPHYRHVAPNGRVFEGVSRHARPTTLRDVSRAYRVLAEREGLR